MTVQVHLSAEVSTLMSLEKICNSSIPVIVECMARSVRITVEYDCTPMDNL